MQKSTTPGEHAHTLWRQADQHHRGRCVIRSAGVEAQGAAGRPGVLRAGEGVAAGETGGGVGGESGEEERLVVDEAFDGFGGCGSAVGTSHSREYIPAKEIYSAG